MHGELKTRCENNGTTCWISNGTETAETKCRNAARRPARNIVWFGEMPLYMDTIERALTQMQGICLYRHEQRRVPCRRFQTRIAHGYGAHVTPTWNSTNATLTRTRSSRAKPATSSPAWCEKIWKGLIQTMTDTTPARTCKREFFTRIYCGSSRLFFIVLIHTSTFEWFDAPVTSLHWVGLNLRFPFPLGGDGVPDAERNAVPRPGSQPSDGKKFILNTFPASPARARLLGHSLRLRSSGRTALGSVFHGHCPRSAFASCSVRRFTCGFCM